MAHRRKSSHPVCKTRRTWDLQADNGTDTQDEDDDEVHQVSSSAANKEPTRVAMETSEIDAQQLVLPSDIYKDFEAVRSQTKLDATNLMRRLLKDYQSVAGGSDKPLNISTSEGLDPDLHGAHSLAASTSIAKDVSLATTRVDTDDDQYQGLDLSVGTRKINSQLFDTKSLDREIGTFDQPLDLTCTKQMGIKEEQNRESPSSSQLDLSGASEFNYVYVYPGLYPPGAVVNANDDLDPHQSMTSPVPELMTPEKIPSPDTLSRAQYLATTEALDQAFRDANPDHRLPDFIKSQPSPGSVASLPQISPMHLKKEPGEVELRPNKPPSYYASRQLNASTPSPSGRGGKSKVSKRSNEMKVISESTSAGVYTSVMKLPWSRRTRTKKPKHKVKLEDTLVPQFMLEENAHQTQHAQQQVFELPGLSPHAPSTPEMTSYEYQYQHSPLDTHPSAPASSQSLMMVYPNAAPSAAQGKPGKKRGRPPKLPMLTKLLHHQKKKGKSGSVATAVTETQVLQAEIAQQAVQHAAQQAQAQGGMLVYNTAGASGPLPPGVMSAIPAPVISTAPQAVQVQASDPQHMQPLPSPSSQFQQAIPAQPPAPGIPNMSQAQFIGQIPLSQLTGGPIQFLGQFPANALPFPGQHIQTIPMSMPEGQAQPQPVFIQGQPAVPISQMLPTKDGTEKVETPNSIQAVNPMSAGAMAPGNVQYAFQPMFVPHGHQMAVPFQQPLPTVTMETDDVSMSYAPNPQMATSSDVNNVGTPGDHNAASMSGVDINATSVMKLSDTNFSTMSTKSVSNTESGAIYQEMILSSKSLTEVKKRKRPTAIQMLKSKSGDDNFLCTSFRIRPRLVAQAQAQKERQAAARGVDVKVEEYDESYELSDPKNLNGPQNDQIHFGETSTECAVDFTNIQIKREVDEDDEVYGNLNALHKQFTEPSVNEPVPKYRNEVTSSPNKPNKAGKRYMLKGSQKRKAKFYGSRIVNEPNEAAMKRQTARLKASSMDTADMDSSDLFQEMFNCKICNTIISVDEMESHSLEHLKTTVYQCKRCGRGFGEKQIPQGHELPMCDTCNEPLVTVGALSESGDDSKIACDECSETFKSLPEFYEHKTAHKNSQNNEGGFECDFCGKVYQYYHALQFHRRTHRERRVPCMDKSCDMKFRSRKEMENHFDSCHPEKKEYFHCVYEGCTKKFLKNFHLQEHIRVKHYNIKAFQCPWPGCVKEFAAQRHLKIHLLIHRDEKPMKCDHCDYRCRQRSAMNWHMRKHPDVPYKYKRAVKSPSISKSESE